jgi:pilus assembly protein Flp/PilA
MFLGGHNKGQGLLEYALILMLVVMVIMLVLVQLGPAVGNMYSNVVVNF